MKKLLIMVFALAPAMVQGQNAFAEYQKKKERQHQAYIDGKSNKFTEYQERKRKQFEEYRKRKNAEFVKYLGHEWVPMPKKDPIPIPRQPEPVKPVVVPKDKANPLPEKPVEVPKGEVVPVPQPRQEPPLEIPQPNPDTKPQADKMRIDFYGLSLPISMNGRLKFELKNLSEKDIASVWDRLSDDAYTPMFDDCAQLIQDLRLNGWATLKLCQAVGEALEGKGTNGAVVLQTYLLTQLGYDARMVRAGNSRLLMICPSTEMLCQIAYMTINGKNYFIFGDVPNDSTIHTYKNNFDAATRSIDFGGATAIRFDTKLSPEKTFTSTWNVNATVSVSVNRNLISFYEGMPFVKDWSFYARQQMDRDLQQRLLPVMRSVTAGKDELATTNELLHFVQTAFVYKTDEEQFKREKTDFKEELFYDEACDCEDRAILFSDLVHNLLGLDVVLLHYPNHMCTAVRFKGNVNGDCVDVKGLKYVICDPTYINASVGSCMPKFKAVKPTIYKVYNDI